MGLNGKKNNIYETLHSDVCKYIHKCIYIINLICRTFLNIIRHLGRYKPHRSNKKSNIHFSYKQTHLCRYGINHLKTVSFWELYKLKSWEGSSIKYLFY